MKASGGVSAISVLFLALAAYLAGCGLLMLLRPGLISMAAGADFLGGLELAGPYMFLLVAAVAALIGVGLLRLNNWARRAAIAVAVVGLVLLVPAVSSAVIGLQWASLAWGGLGVIVRVMVAWYLWQEPVRESFENKTATDPQGFPRI
jgi:multidrug transporter EmrE-like cation transporter